MPPEENLSTEMNIKCMMETLEIIHSDIQFIKEQPAFTMMRDGLIIYKMRMAWKFLPYLIVIMLLCMFGGAYGMFLYGG